MPRTALYPGTFDPLTNGHVDVLKAALRVCDRLVLGLGVHPAKAPMLSVDDRLELLETVAVPMGKAAGVPVEAMTFDNLVVDFAREVGATILIRGLRDGTDLDYEMQMAGTNGTLAPWLQTVFLPATPAARHITATLVRQIASMGGDIAPFVPTAVAERLKQRLAQQSSA
jgi:pantetheine-phosphate adenylyltransferase